MDNHIRNNRRCQEKWFYDFIIYLNLEKIVQQFPFLIIYSRLSQKHARVGKNYHPFIPTEKPLNAQKYIEIRQQLPAS